jgi:hypothetical protein
LRFKGSYFAEAPQMPLGQTKPARQESLDEIPSYGRSHGPAAHTNNVHVVVLDALLGREMVMHEARANARNLVSANGCADPAAADGYAAVHFSRRYCPGQGDNEVGIVVTRVQAVSAEIDYLMPRLAKLRDKLLFQTESTVISSDSNPHILSSTLVL